MPANLTFNSGDTEQTFTFMATNDDYDDDDESVLLGFGGLPIGVSPGATDQTTISITDNDHPQVTVSFGQAAYSVDEGANMSVTVTLSADPERMVIIPITHTPQGGAESPADYSGVPANLTFNSGEMSKTFTFTATKDMIDDDGESVLLGFGTLPLRVSAGAARRRRSASTTTMGWE